MGRRDVTPQQRREQSEPAKSRQLLAKPVYTNDVTTPPMYSPLPFLRAKASHLSDLDVQ